VDTGLLTLIGMAGVGVALLGAMFVLPRRKLAEEKEKKPLYEERCSAYWRFARGAVVAGGNIPIARISFYDDFFVVALVKLTKAFYSEVLSTDFKAGWLSNSITIHFATGRSLVLHPKNFEKVRSLVETSAPR
jgi:hypothetical protein